MPLVLIWRMFRDDVGGPGLGWISPAWARRAGSHVAEDAAEYAAEVVAEVAAGDAAEVVAGDAAGDAADDVAEDVAWNAAEVEGLNGKAGPGPGGAGPVSTS